MDIKHNLIAPENTEIATPRRGQRFVRSLEYELMANLVSQQFQKNDETSFEQLLAIPLTERIPSLVTEYGLKRMHKLVKTILQEFCISINLPKSRKLTETRTSVCACDLILAAHEDQLALEDLILFFELAKKGKYGPFKKMVSHYMIMEKLGQYRDQRHQAYVKLKEERERELKNLGPAQRISSEPTSIKQLFDDHADQLLPLKKIS